MYYTPSSVRTQQRFIQSRRTEGDCQSTFNLLTSDILLDEVEKRLPEHRERLFPPTETLAMFVTQALSADRSCQPLYSDWSPVYLSAVRVPAAIAGHGSDYRWRWYQE